MVVRPSTALMNVSTQQLDPLSVGRKLLVRFVLAGSFLRSDKGFDLNWQLLDVQGQSVRTGGAINVASFDLIAAIPEECIAVCESGIRNSGEIARLRAAGFDAFLIGESLMTEIDPGAALTSLLGAA